MSELLTGFVALVVGFGGFYYAMRYGNYVFNELTRNGFKTITRPSLAFKILFPLHFFLLPFAVGIFFDRYTSQFTALTEAFHPSILLAAAGPLYVLIAGHWLAAAKFARLSAAYVIGNFAWWLVVAFIAVAFCNKIH